MMIHPPILVPAAPEYYEGHFPGRPILPGVAEILFVHEALSRVIGGDVAIAEIPFFRFRHPVMPGDELLLQSSAPDVNPVRIDLIRSDQVIANGALVLGNLNQVQQPVFTFPENSEVSCEFPLLDKLMPHRPPMRFIEAVEIINDHVIQCLGRIPRQCPFVKGEKLHPVFAIEAAAQASAAWLGIRFSRQPSTMQEGESPGVGYLVSLKSIRFYTSYITVDTPFKTVIEQELSMPPMSNYKIQVSLGDKLIVSGSIATILADH